MMSRPLRNLLRTLLQTRPLPISLQRRNLRKFPQRIPAPSRRIRRRRLLPMAGAAARSLGPWSASWRLPVPCWRSRRAITFGQRLSATMSRSRPSMRARLPMLPSRIRHARPSHPSKGALLRSTTRATCAPDESSSSRTESKTCLARSGRSPAASSPCRAAPSIHAPSGSSPRLNTISALRTRSCRSGIAGRTRLLLWSLPTTGCGRWPTRASRPCVS